MGTAAKSANFIDWRRDERKKEGGHAGRLRYAKLH